MRNSVLDSFTRRFHSLSFVQAVSQGAYALHQQSHHFFIPTPVPSMASVAKCIHRRIDEMIALDSQPFPGVEDERYRYLIKELNL